MRRLLAFLDQMNLYPFFLKDRQFSHQVEYRLLWVTSLVGQQRRVQAGKRVIS